MYVVVFVCNTLSDQVITLPLDFTTASELATCLTADLVNEGSNLNEEYYVVQPFIM